MHTQVCLAIDRMLSWHITASDFHLMDDGVRPQIMKIPPPPSPLPPSPRAAGGPSDSQPKTLLQKAAFTVHLNLLFTGSCSTTSSNPAKCHLQVMNTSKECMRHQEGRIFALTKQLDDALSSLTTNQVLLWQCPAHQSCMWHSVRVRSLCISTHIFEHWQSSAMQCKSILRQK